MKRMECQIKNCNRPALVAYGDKWICGNCMVAIIEKQKERKQQEMDELGDELI